MMNRSEKWVQKVSDDTLDSSFANINLTERLVAIEQVNLARAE